MADQRPDNRHVAIAGNNRGLPFDRAGLKLNIPQLADMFPGKCDGLRKHRLIDFDIILDDQPCLEATVENGLPGLAVAEKAADFANRQLERIARFMQALAGIDGVNLPGRQRPAIDGLDYLRRNWADFENAIHLRPSRFGARQMYDESLYVVCRDHIAPA